MNEKIDPTLETLKTPGSLWINENNKQLRFQISSDDPTNWIVPLSIYEVGNNLENNKAFIKRGQPVSLGHYDELDPIVQQSADPAIVPTNPINHQWCIGLALEPGNATNVDNQKIFNHVHILSHGQIEYNLNDNRENIFQPPYSITNNEKKYIWTYDDIGSPVYISNHPDDNNGEVGGLTIDITHAYYGGARIISIGRIADAPLATDDVTKQKIIIEIALAGDVRGMIDSTQFDVDIISKDDLESELPIINTTNDKLIFVKIKELLGKPIGYIITSDDDILADGGQHSPIGAFVANPDSNGRIDLNQYLGKTILCNRLGILEGEIKSLSFGGFGFVSSDYGKELFLSNGEITTLGSAGTYEYKVGLVLDSNRVLIDCRYPRLFKKFDAIGTIKPAYQDRITNKTITEPGYIEITTDPHKVSGVWLEDNLYPNIDFTNLIQITMFSGIYEFSDNKNGPWTELNGSESFSDIRNKYFRFKDLFYHTSDGEVISQIKYTQEGSPEEMSYLWPEMNLEYIWLARNDLDINEKITGYNNPGITFDITYLTNLGYYLDGNGNNIEDFDITLKIVDNDNGKLFYLAPGFFTIIRNNIMYYYGYQWSLFQQNNRWILGIYTQPNSLIPKENCLGITWPLTEKNTEDIKLLINIRRRPSQYHNLMLNQLIKDFPWKPFTDGQNLITRNSLFFGDIISNSDQDTYSVAPGATEFRLMNQEPLIGQNGTTTYWKRYIENLGEQFDTSWHQIDFFEHYITPSNQYSQTYNRTTGILWTYDFKNNAVTLSADLALSLKAKNTSMPKQTSTELKRYIDFIGDYNKDSTKENPNGVYTTPRSALKTLHEIPIGFFKYTDNDIDTVIGTAQEQWNTHLELSPERFLNFDIEREIFPSLNGYAPATTYKYKSINSATPEAAGEWQHIIEEINILYKDIIRNQFDNTIIDGGNYQSFQSNVSLLNYAARETQDRLLKLERAMFGTDAPSLPEGIIGVSEKTFEPYQTCLDDGGVLRISSQLLKNEIIKTTNDEDRPYFSMYKDLLYEIFGTYSDSAIGNNFESNKYNYSIDPNSGKFHTIYWFVNELMPFKRRMFEYSEPNIQEVNIYGYTNASRIYLDYHINNKFPFSWAYVEPITTTYKTNNEQNWWTSHIIGTTQDDIISQSVEGLLKDVIYKLSYIKENSDSYTQSLNSYFTFIYKRPTIAFIDLNTRIQSVTQPTKNFENDNETSFFIDELNFEGGDNHFNGTYDGTIIPHGKYSSFGFIDDKISSAGSLNVAAKYLPNNASNIDLFEEVEDEEGVLITMPTKHWKYISGDNDSVENAISYWADELEMGLDSDDIHTIDGELNFPDNFIGYRYNSYGRQSLDGVWATEDEIDDIISQKDKDINNYMALELSSDIYEYNQDDSDEEIESTVLNINNDINLGILATKKDFTKPLINVEKLTELFDEAIDHIKVSVPEITLPINTKIYATINQQISGTISGRISGDVWNEDHNLILGQAYNVLATIECSGYGTKGGGSSDGSLDGFFVEKEVTVETTIEPLIAGDPPITGFLTGTISGYITGNLNFNSQEIILSSPLNICGIQSGIIENEQYESQINSSDIINIKLINKIIKQTYSNNEGDSAKLKITTSVTQTNADTATSDPNMSEKSFTLRPTIRKFRINGANIPTKYDMITRIRGKEHVADQLHLVEQFKPTIYPQENFDWEKPNYGIITLENGTEYPKGSPNVKIISGGQTLIWWKPIKNINGYTIFSIAQRLVPNSEDPLGEVVIETPPADNLIVHRRTPLNCFLWSSPITNGVMRIYIRKIQDIDLTDEEQVFLIENDFDHDAVMQLPNIVDYFIFSEEHMKEMEITNSLLSDLCDKKTASLINKFTYNLYNG